VSYSAQRRRPGIIVDERFEGRSLEVHTVDGEKLVGLVDEVASLELGMLVEGDAVVVERGAILYMVTGLTDIHGVAEGCEKELVLDEEFVGRDLVIRLINGAEIRGRLIKVARHEIGVAQENRAVIIPRSAISFVRIHRG